MKQKVSKHIISVLLVIVIMIGIIPTITLTAYAAPGDSEYTPMACETFAEFKTAMEDPSIGYVLLKPMDETLPVLEEGELVFAINVAGEKHLYIADGVSRFRASANGGVYDSLLNVGVGSSLTIDGYAGELAFNAVGTASHNAIIYNQGGDIRIEGGYLYGEYNTATYGKVIWQESGTLNIIDGTIRSKDGVSNKQGSKDTYPVYLAGGSTNILGGEFRVEETQDPEAKPYGLCVEENASLEIRGGIFYGIRLPANKAVGEYVGDGYDMTINGSYVDPMNYGTISGSDKVCVGTGLVIDEIKTVMAIDRVPKAGMEVDHFIPNVPDGENYSRPWNGVSWYDANGIAIEPSINHHYDLGYEFEPGHVYYADYEYTTVEGYVFSENPSVTFTGPDPSMFTYEIIDRSNDGTRVTVRYTFTIPGEFGYPDINKVSMEYTGNVSEGAEKPYPVKMIYNNCTIWYQEWNTGSWGSECTWDIQDGTGNQLFKAGENYVHMIELRANSGYKFSPDLIVQKGRQGYEEIGEVVLSADRTIATVSYNYHVAGIECLDTVNLWSKAGDDDFYLIRGDRNLSSGVPFTTKYDDTDPYTFWNYYWWYDVETGEEIKAGIADYPLELGKKYQLEFLVNIKDEYTDTIRFGKNPTLVLNDYQYANADFVKIETECSDRASQMRVKITYTAQPKPGEGSDMSHPLICYTYHEFEYAMENKDIRYIALGDVEDMLPWIPHDPNVNDNRTNAIVVRGYKVLQLMGDAVFTCPVIQNYDYKTYEQLISLTSAADSTLHIRGNGSLTFNGSNMYYYNSVIKMDGGTLTVSDATIRGSNGNHTGYCYGINALSGNMIIQDNATIRGGVYDGDGICALSLGDEGLNESLSVTISGGNFYVDRGVEDGHYDHGLWVANDCGLRIHGGTFDGIKLERYADDNLGSYVQNGSVMTVDGQKVDPADYNTINGQWVEIYKEISKVDIHVNSPVAGEVPTMYVENVWLVPDGSTVKSIGWYENGEAWNISNGAERFEAESTYEVEIVLTADDGVKFASPLTSTTINYKKADIQAYAGNSEKGIVMRVNFGKCPAVINLIELNVTAPKKGETISYTVTDISDAYNALGTGNNIAAYRQWMESTDGGDSWRVMEAGETFKGGYCYKFYVDVGTANSYEFPVYDDGTSIVPDVSATINGCYATVHKAYEEDPSRYVTVEYFFGYCNDDVIDKIVIDQIAAPVPGETPDYEGGISGNGYTFGATSGNWKVNGIAWYENDYNSLDCTDTFKVGESYTVYIDLEALDGYTFYVDKYNTPLTTATVNGNPATVEVLSQNNDTKHRIKYTFDWNPITVTELLITGLDEPMGGAAPDFDVTLQNDLLYNATVTWCEYYYEGSTGSPLTPEDTFLPEAKYQVEIKITPNKDSNQADVCNFNIPEVGVKLNGILPSEVYRSNKAVYIYHVFRRAPQAPSLGANVSGTVTSFQDESGEVTIGLYEGEAANPTYTATVTGNTADYLIENVEAGTYIMKVSKANHVTREYEVVVASEDVEQDAKIHLLGDISGDGQVNIADNTRMIRHIKKTKLLTGYEFEVADISGDDQVNIADNTRMIRHIKKTKLLW